MILFRLSLSIAPPSSACSLQIVLCRSSLGSEISPPREFCIIGRHEGRLYSLWRSFTACKNLHILAWHSFSLRSSPLQNRVSLYAIAHRRSSAREFAAVLSLSFLSGASKLAGTQGSEEEMKAAFTAETPLGRAQATWDIGITAVYLASEAARCINGDIIVSIPRERAA